MKLRLRLAPFAAVALGSLALALAPSLASSQPEEICANLHSTQAIDPGFSDIEKRLACGQGSGASDIQPEWKTIPTSQREYHIRVFLQARGYENPSFEIRGGKLWVDPGAKRKVTAIRVEGAPHEPGASFDYSRKRLVVGQTLTPALLDDLKSWTKERLRGLGYACPKIALTANPDNGVIIVRIRPGARDILAGIIESDVPGLMPGIFSRYYAFSIGSWFDGDALTLTGQRVIADGQVESYKLSVDHCEGDRAYARQEIVTGKPRLLSFGFGANTEGVLIGTAEWKNTRLGNTASLLDFQIAASTKQQLFSGSGNWYFLDWPSRIYLRPLIFTSHQNLDPYETITERVTPTIQTSTDTSAMGYQFGFGPSYMFIDNLRGSGARFTHFLFLESTFRAATHYFDFYQTAPRSGFLLNLSTDLSDRHVLSDMYAQQLQLNLEALWNLNEYSPPLVVFGLRAAAASTITDTGDAFHALVPPPLRQYLGGSNNLRGFGLLELPEDQIGRLTSVSTGIETRLVSVLPWGIQPFTFLDAGELGASAFNLDAPLYWSPGIGFRLESPIGIFRGTLAHGYLSGNPLPQASHFQLFLSYGEEF